MKVFMIIAIIIVGIGAASFLLFRNNKTAFIEKAKEAETMGKYNEAATFYARSLLTSVPVKSVPAIGLQSFQKSDEWVKQISDYKEWISRNADKEPDSYRAIIDGVAGVIKKHTPVNKVSKYTINPFTVEEYKHYWEDTVMVNILSKKKQVDDSFFENLYNDSISLVKLSTPKYYTYEIHVVNRSTKQAITTTVYPDTAVHIMAKPGLHLLIAKSTVTFPSGELWVSPYSLLPLSIPESPSLILAELYTSVSR